MQSQDMQKQEKLITQTEQAKALQDTAFLSQFVQMNSPSDVAKKLGMAANLAHHYVQKYESLELLQEVKRDTKVYYQLTAKTYKIARNIWAVSQSEHYAHAELNRLKNDFLRAYEITDGLLNDANPNWHEVAFVEKGEEASTSQVKKGEHIQAYPPHLQIRSLTLSSEAYLNLVNTIAELIEQAESQGSKNPNGHCKVSFLAFQPETKASISEGTFITSFALNIA